MTLRITNHRDIVEVHGDRWRLRGTTLAPRIAGESDAPLVFDDGDEHPERIGGVWGTCTHQRARFAGGEVLREIFRSNDGSMMAVRLSFTNRRPAAVALESLVPLSADALTVADAGLADWRIVRMSRQKNDVPGNFRFTDQDIDFDHARMDAAEFKAGLGVQAGDLAPKTQDPTTVQADPCLWIRHRTDDSAPGLFIGVLGQTEHLTAVLIGGSEDFRQFRTLAVRCDFDSVLVQPGETRSTHWVVLWQDTDEEAMRQRYIDLLADVMQIPAPKRPPPSYFCSWYFYGTDFTQADLDENLTELKKRPIPFDVLLLDNGWMDDFGSYNANSLFPRGMQHVASQIRAAGYQPGIWTCPFVVMQDSSAHQEYPNLIARDDKGEPILFPYEKIKTWVVDPTSPDAEAYFTELFGKLKAWGFTAHKFDFLRAITSYPRIRFHDRSKNRAQAYRYGMAMIRRLAGDDAYILACGGLFEASAGLVDAVRVGADTKGRWADPNGKTAYQRMGYVVRVKQNVFRNHTNRLWHTDPDALQLRRRDTPFREREEFFHLAQGSFTDDEAMTLIAHQYVGGGIVCLCERMAELPDDRYALLRRVMPTYTPPAKVLDFGTFECPTRLRTRVTPRAAGVEPWWTLTVFNWGEEPIEREMPLGLPGEPRVAVMELVTQEFLGVHRGSEALRLAIPRHGVRVLRLARWDGVSPMLLGTDGHLSGGVELSELRFEGDRVFAKLDWPWAFPVRIKVGIPRGQVLQSQAFTISQAGRPVEFRVGVAGPSRS